MSEKLDLRGLTSGELEMLASDLDFEAYRGRQLFRWLWTPSIHSLKQMTNLPAAFRHALEEVAAIPIPSRVAIQESIDGTIKFCLKLQDNSLVESVIIREEGYHTLCVSSQVGCQMGCRFCRTAHMGFKRDLSPSEIVIQVLHAIEILGARVRLRNIVFMGMGEPLENYDNLKKALHILMDPSGLDFSKRRITVSTSGIIPGIKRLGQDFDVGLAVSLHAPLDQLRSEIMPINRRYGLDALLETLRTYPLTKRRRITIEYLLLGGVNDSEHHARELVKRLAHIPVKVNLITFNSVEGIPFAPPSKEAVQRFQEVLLKKGFTATLRKSRGTDIDAACGQLAARSRDYETSDS